MNAPTIKLLGKVLVPVSIILALISYSFAQDRSDQDDSSWVIRNSLSMAITNFKITSPVIADMRTYEAPDVPVYAPTGDGDGTDDASNIELMPIYSLLACMSFTNLDSVMTVDSGGGYDIRVRNAQFAGGIWDADVRIIERTMINGIESDTTLLLDRVVVGTLAMETNEDRIATIRLLVDACI